MQWSVTSWPELSRDALYALLRLRAEVFVVEQQCPFQDLDDKDRLAEVWHLQGYSAAAAGELLAYARILAFAPGELVISRVVVSPRARGQQLGHALLRQALAVCAARGPSRGIKLSAQAHLQDFYAQHGFVARGEVYLEDDIPHIAMYRVPAV
ncbi:MAG: GNAT family N-acetyltransferase [Aeromonas sp.]